MEKLEGCVDGKFPLACYIASLVVMAVENFCIHIKMSDPRSVTRTTEREELANALGIGYVQL